MVTNFVPPGRTDGRTDGHFQKVLKSYETYKNVEISDLRAILTILEFFRQMYNTSLMLGKARSIITIFDANI